MIEISLIAAVSDNGVIGRDGDLPWSCPEDLKHFKETTLGHPMVLGHTTWKSFGGRALPRRPHIVIASHLGVEIAERDRNSVLVATSIKTALDLGRMEAERLGVGKVFVIGGQSIYEQTIASAHELLLSKISLTCEGDKRFPEIDLNVWKGMSIDSREGPPAFTIVHYERR